MKHMDDILKQALTPKDEPEFWLNQNILAQSKEGTRMKKKNMNQKKFATIVCSMALVLIIGSISVYAAWKYLMPDQVIDEMSQQYEQSAWEFGDLKDAFSEENAVWINETQSYGGFDVTLLGVTSGENLTNYKYITDDTEQTDRTYILFAVEHESLTLESSRDFEGYFDIFPVVMGYDYEKYNGLFLSGSGGREFKKDGVLYYMFECNNLEKFADHDIYMCVTDDIGFTEYSYLYDNDKNLLARNTEYEGLNALFSVPLDPAKANPKAVADAIKEADDARQKNLEKENLPLTPGEKALQEAYAFLEQITPENITDYATPLTQENAIQTFTPDSQGRVHLDISFEYKGFLNESHAKLPLTHMFPDGAAYYITSSGAQNYNLDSLLIELYTLNEDGTVTLQFYEPNFSK